MDDQCVNNGDKNKNSSDKQTGYHSKEGHFNLQDYYVKKLTFKSNYEKSLLKQKQNSKNEGKKWQFKNSCLLPPNEKVKIKPSEMYIALANSLKEYLEHIEAIGQYASSKNWVIKFKD